MTKLAPARRAALDILVACRRRGARARDLMRTSPIMDGLEPRDRALTTRLVLGAVGAQGTLDAAIDAHVRSASKLEPRVRDALRISAFELMFLSTSPAVAVSQGVELVRCVVPQAASMANAVLRRIGEEERSQVVAAREHLSTGEVTDDDLALVGGMPVWLARELIASMGESQAAELALGNTEPAPVFVAANTVKHTFAETYVLLEEANLEPIPQPLPGCYVLASPAGLAKSGLVGQASVLPCDLSSQLVAHIAAVSPTRRLLEVGQGRGTKTILLAGITRRIGAPAEIVSCDNDESKVRISAARMKQAGVEDDVSCLWLDGRTIGWDSAPEAVNREFDTVFLDAPCSGVGTLRRHPEIAWSLDPVQLDAGNAASLPALQQALLTAASTRVRLGGALVYATCSPLIQEDEAVVQAFLDSEAGRTFKVDRIDRAPGLASAGEAGAALILEGVRSDGCWRSTGALSSDYHFAVRLIRRR